MDDEFSPLKINLYLFSSTDVYQQQVQKQLLVKEKKARSLTGLPTYTSSLTIGSNP